MKVRAALLAAAAAALALPACRDPIRIEASLEVVEDTLTVFALSGTPVTSPTALNTRLHQVLRLEPPSSADRYVDVVFDLGPSGEVLLYPVQEIGSLPGRTGLRTVEGAFDALTRAPTDGYEDDGPLAVGVGQLVAIRAEPLTCANDLKGPEIFSKLVVLEVNPAVRAIRFLFRVNPNCGFRDFSDGIPRD